MSYNRDYLMDRYDEYLENHRESLCRCYELEDDKMCSTCEEDAAWQREYEAMPETIEMRKEQAMVYASVYLEMLATKYRDEMSSEERTAELQVFMTWFLGTPVEVHQECPKSLMVLEFLLKEAEAVGCPIDEERAAKARAKAAEIMTNPSRELQCQTILAGFQFFNETKSVGGTRHEERQSIALEVFFTLLAKCRDLLAVPKFGETVLKKVEEFRASGKLSEAACARMAEVVEILERAAA